MTHKPIKPDKDNQIDVDSSNETTQLNEISHSSQNGHSKNSQIGQTNQSGQGQSSSYFSKKKIYLAITFVFLFSSIGLAQIIVHDPKHMVQNGIEFAKNLKELQKHQSYREFMDGGWKDPMKVLKLGKLTLASLGIDTAKLGWDGDNFRDEPAVRVATEGINQLNKVLKGDIPGGSDLSQVIQEVYGDIPVTRRGAQVRMAYESVTGTISQTGNSENAIKQVLENSDDIQTRYEAGGLTNGDRERLKGMEQNLQLRVQALNAQAMNQNNLLLAQSLAMQASKEARQERERLSQRQQMLRAMGSLNVGLGSTKNKGEE